MCGGGHRHTWDLRLSWAAPDAQMLQ